MFGRGTIARVTGGIKVKADRGKNTYVAMLAAQDVAEKCKTLPCTSNCVPLGCQSAVRALARSSMKIDLIIVQHPGGILISECEYNKKSFWLLPVVSTVYDGHRALPVKESVVYDIRSHLLRIFSTTGSKDL